MLLIAIFAAASAWLVTRKAPQHQPLAWALTMCACLDAVRLLGLPARVDMALVLAAPSVSAWAYWKTFLGSNQWMACLGLWCGLACAVVDPRALSYWYWLPASGYGCSTVIGGLTLYTRVKTPLKSDPWTISQRVALIFLAGDALAVASLCAREWISNQAGVVLAAVTVYQLTWWWRWRRWEPR